MVISEMDEVFESPFPPYPNDRERFVFPKPISRPPLPTRIEQDTIKNIRLSRLLGTGGFGSVYLGQLGTTEVAVKRLHSVTKNIAARDESFKAEKRLLNLYHPNIVSVLGVTEDTQPEDAMIVMEYIGDVNLQQLMNRMELPFDVYKRMRYALNIAAGLDYIHTNRVVHLDLKPANVLISPDDVCKLADFGCCQELEGATGMVSPTNRSHLTGTFAYRAPELFRGKPPSTKADVYALGVTLWQMLSMEQPYNGQPQECVIFAVVSAHRRPKLPDTVAMHVDLDHPVEICYCDLYKQCWDADIQTRPSAADLVEVLAMWKQEVASYNFDDNDDDKEIADASMTSEYELYSYTRDESFNIMDVM